MNYERFNPCGTRLWADLLAWAETGCWCCTATRALLVGGWLGSLVTVLLMQRWWLAVLVLLAGAPIVTVLLYVAREIWAESYAPDEEQPK
jgi:hypothetical protein